MHDGTGVCVYGVLSQNSAGGGQFFLTNRTVGPCGLEIATGATIYSPLYGNSIPVGYPGDPVFGVGVGNVLKRQAKTGLSPYENTMRVGTGTEVGANFTGALQNADASYLSLGCYTTAGIMNGFWASMLMFSRIPSTTEDAIVRAYYLSKYGVT
jgi:hypothetical protein